MAAPRGRYSATTPETSAGCGKGVPSLGQQAGLWQSRDRHARAVQFITQGLTYQQVADQMGYANKGTVHHLVGKTLTQTTSAAVEAVRSHRSIGCRYGRAQVAPAIDPLSATFLAFGSGGRYPPAISAPAIAPVIAPVRAPSSGGVNAGSSAITL